jgi:DNA-directed RNA polymerase subunit RPC12/RpoP
VAQDAASATTLLDHPVSTVLLSLSGELLTEVEHERLDHSEALCLRLQVLLSQAPAGTRLYAVGDESFLWQAQRTARQAGLLVDEIELFKQGTRRRLYCVHCSGFQDVADEGECTCSHCGLRLLVREHFSQRLGAYMGVCLNPDQPYAEARS